jgi:signal transduction histidine kinase
MISALLVSILYAVITVGGLSLAVLIRQRARDKRPPPWLTIYLLAAALWAGLLLARSLGWLPVPLTRLVWYGVPAQAILFLWLSGLFLQQSPRRNNPWQTAGFLALILTAVFDLNPFHLLPQSLTLAARSLTRDGLILFTAFLGWTAVTAQTLWLTHLAYRQTTRQPLHRNRVIYWFAILSCLILSDLLFFLQQETFAAIIRLPGLFIAGYALLTYQLLDVRRGARRAISYGVAAALVILLYTAGILSVAHFSPAVLVENGLAVGAVLAVLGAILFQPLFAGSRRLVGRLTGDAIYDTPQLLREYSLSISNIVELSRLEAVMMGHISEAMAIQHGTFFLVDRQAEADGREAYAFRSVQSFGPERFVLGKFMADSPISRYFYEENKPLLQYDVDLLPKFQATDPDEREWLAAQGIEVYVPIVAHDNWIGLLGLGPKSSGHSYDKGDLILLSALADQTAVALENARLFEDLQRANADLQQAYAALARVNSQLQEVDRLKSAFIGVVTHELRTPFAGLGFSLQLLERYGAADWPESQRQEFDNLKTGVETAKRMVDNLVTFAAFLSKQGQLRLEPIEIPHLIAESLLAIRPLADNKDIQLTVVGAATSPVTADAERLGEALHHLLHNAVKFTGQGGQVWLRYGEMDGRLQVEVEDNGVGVPADRLETLWESFEQMADPLQRGAEGLGLGLALVKYVVTAHGGRVWADSREGEGSVFGFEIPLTQPAFA